MRRRHRDRPSASSSPPTFQHRTSRPSFFGSCLLDRDPITRSESDEPISPLIFSDLLQEELLHLLQTSGIGPKTLVVGDSLYLHLELFTTVPILREEANIEKILPCSIAELPHDEGVHRLRGLGHACVFVVRSSCHNAVGSGSRELRNCISLIEKLGRPVRSRSRNRPRQEEFPKSFVYLVPYPTWGARQLLEPVSRYIAMIHSFGFDFVPVDTDMFSMAMEHSFRRIHVDQDPDAFGLIARAIVKFESVFGRVPMKDIRFVGESACRVKEGIRRLRALVDGEMPSDHDDSSETGNSVIDEILIIDRSVDLVTPLMMPHTYGAIIEAIYGIKKNSVFDFDEKILVPNAQDAKFQEAMIPPECLPREKPEFEEDPSGLPDDLSDSTEDEEDDYLDSVSVSTLDLAPNDLQKLVLNSDDRPFREMRYLLLPECPRQIRVLVPVFQDREETIHERTRDGMSGTMAAKKVSRAMVAAFGYSEQKQYLSAHFAVLQTLTKGRKAEMLRELILTEQTMIMGTQFARWRTLEKKLWGSDSGVFDEILLTVSREEASVAETSLVSPLCRALEFACLWSLASGGLREGLLDHVYRSLFHSFGMDVTLMFRLLRDAGLLADFDPQLRREWQSLKKTLQLYSTSAEENRRRGEIRYCYSGYAPIAIRLVEEHLRNDPAMVAWMKSQFEPNVSFRPATESCYTPLLSKKRLSRRRRSQFSGSSVTEESEGPEILRRSDRVIMLLFVGGICRGELAALQRIQAKSSNHLKFIVMTTEVISGSFVRQFVVECPPGGYHETLPDI